MAVAQNIFQFADGIFGTALNATITQEVSAGLTATRGWLHGAAAVWLIATLVLALMQHLSFGRLIQRVLRVLIVSTLITSPGLYTQYIVTPVMTTFPNAIASAFSQELAAGTVPQQFAALFASIENISAQLRAQAQGAFYIPERISINLAELCCKWLLMPQYGLYLCVTTLQGLLLIAGTICLIFFLYDKTQTYGEAWAGALIGGLVATLLMSIALQVIYRMYSSYMVSAVTLPLSRAGDGLNISEGIEVLGNIAAMFLLGLFLAVVAVLFGYAIGRSVGFNASSVVSKLARGGVG